jgi:hypothetical protein
MCRFHRNTVSCFFIFLIVMLFSRSVAAQSVSLAWDPAADASVVGYVVRYGTASGSYPNQINVGLATAHQVNGLAAGTKYYFVVQSYDGAGVRSDYSNAVSITTAGVSGGSGGGSTGGGSGSGSGSGGSSSGGSSSAASASATAPAGATNAIAHLRDSRTIEISWLAINAASYRVEVGTSPGHTAYSAVTNSTMIEFDTSNVPSANYFIRVRPMIGGVPGGTSNEVVVASAGLPLLDTMTDAAGGQCVDGPGAPRHFTSGANGTAVHLAWQPGTGATASSYLLQVGSAPGLQNLMTVPLPAGQTSLSASAANGFYALRMIAMNACGASVWGAESLLGVGSGSAMASGGAVPAAPTALSEQVSGALVSLNWSAPAGGATRYLIEATTPAGPVSFDTGNPSTSFSHPDTPSGEYVITVRAGNASGFGPPSNPVTVVVP